MDNMRERLTRYLTRGKDTFLGFTAGQKAVVIIGSLALVLAAVMVFRWASTPSYSPLYSNLSGQDASAIVDELQTEGVPYQITGGGGTIMVPQADVYSTRITLSGKGLPSSSDPGYSILDNEGLSTSEFQQQTDYQRAMEGELANTIEAIDGINTAIVHLAIPQKQVFSDQQTPTTASVLIDTDPGTTMTDEQVQAIVHLVASSIQGLDPKDVTITDQHGTVLTIPDDGSGLTAASSQAQDVQAFSDTVKSQIQATLDKVVGPGNSTITVTPVLNFDKATQVTRQYLIPNKKIPPLSESHSLETYKGAGGAAANGVGGVVGPNGQMGPTNGSTSGPTNYQNSSSTQDNADGERIEHREQAPGSLQGLHIGVVLNQTTAAAIQPQVIKKLIAAGVGINTKRGDTIDVSSLPFDQSAQTAAANELAAAAAAKNKASQMAMIRDIGIAGLIALMLILAWLQARRRAMAREEATEYLVEQLRADQAERLALENQAPVPVLDAAPVEPEDDGVREELLALVERQPEDVAALLRGWLVEPR
ncbi:MAG: flagellar M-ring protein FliF [Nocardioidaceae bacterium]|nr:flagellar M-ring protein FliF [Nocardioidaceae bacterium]MCL2613794.1 flagellar M-ring protein FliF [Nocardioidaceae bacterium]